MAQQVLAFVTACGYMHCMEPILHAAMLRLDAARSEVRRLEEFVRTFHELAGGTTSPNLNSAGSAKTEVLGRQTNKVAEAERVARSVIVATGKPVSTADLLVEFEKRGVPVGGFEPRATLHARLSRAHSLEYRKPLGWRIREAANQQEGAEGSGSPTPEEPTAPVASTSSPVEPVAGGGT